jgi:hypothetical protein
VRIAAIVATESGAMAAGLSIPARDDYDAERPSAAGHRAGSESATDAWRNARTEPGIRSGGWSARDRRRSRARSGRGERAMRTVTLSS